MLENNLVFSLVSSSIICIIIYCINYKKNLNEDKKNEIILLFGISFTTIFILRILSQNNKQVISTGGGTINSYKAPF
jgi:hypothetical protein